VCSSDLAAGVRYGPVTAVVDWLINTRILQKGANDLTRWTTISL
jgi:hypothetical protein